MRKSSLLVVGLYLTGCTILADDATVRPKQNAVAQAVTPQDAEFFEAKIRPILERALFQVSRAQQAGIGTTA